MKPIDQTVSIDDEIAACFSFGSTWSSLEEAARDGRVSGYADMSALGALLGEALFPAGSPSAADLVANLAAAQHENRILRLCFIGQTANLPVEFVTLPDELLSECDERGIVIADPALGLHDRVELVRASGGIEQDLRRTEVSQEDPLRILIAVANPAADNWPNIPRAEPQARIIESACRGIGGNYVSVEFVAGCTRQSLAEAIEAHKPHILHFVGHGAKVADNIGEASLVLHPDGGPGVDLLSSAELLAMCTTLPELITLNACHLGGAETLLRGFSATLIEAGVSLVLAMQLPVLDTVAEQVAEGVYRPFLRGLPLSMALASIRRQIAIDDRRRHFTEWATPVLYSRVTDTARFAGIPPVGIAEARSRAGARQFVGREWLWGEVEKHLEEPENKVTLLVAEAGMGKSSFLEFCRRRLEASMEIDDPRPLSSPLILDYRYHYGERADALSCAGSLSDQLRSWLDENNQQVPEERPPDAYGSPYVRACAILGDLVAAASAHTKVILLLDALDEASEARDALPIAELLGELPENLSAFATTRPEWYAKWRMRYPGGATSDDVRQDSRFSVITLEPLSTTNLQDVALFLQNTFGPYRIGFSASECLELAQQVGGSFLVADILCGMIRAGDGKELVRDRFKEAESVTGAYDLVFRTIAADLVSDAKGSRKLRDTEDLLAFVTCARDPLTDEQLRYLFGARDDDSEVKAADALADALNHLRRFFSSDISEYGEQLYRPYHQSLRSYGERRLGIQPDADASSGRTEKPGPNEIAVIDTSLTSQKPLPRTVQEYRQLWADYCLQWNELEHYPKIYALRHLVPHLIALEGDEPVAEIEKALTNYSYIAAALGADPSKPERPLDVNELIAHYESADRRKTTSAGD